MRSTSIAPSSLHSIGRKAQKEAELATVAAAVRKLEAVLPVLQERVEIRQKLLLDTHWVKSQYLEL